MSQTAGYHLLCIDHLMVLLSENRYCGSHAFVNLGTLANDRGNLRRAQDYYEQALGEARQMGAPAPSQPPLACIPREESPKGTKQSGGGGGWG